MQMQTFQASAAFIANGWDATREVVHAKISTNYQNQFDTSTFRHIVITC